MLRNEWYAVIAGSAVLLLVILWVLVKARKPKGRLCGGCNRKMLPTWPRCLFCGWAPAAYLEFIAGPLVGQKVQLTVELTTLGSTAGNTIVLADPAVSKKHAGVRKVDGGFEVADLGSMNGVYVNGQKVPKKLLVVGDIVRVGNSEAAFKQDR